MSDKRTADFLAMCPIINTRKALTDTLIFLVASMLLIYILDLHNPSAPRPRASDYRSITSTNAIAIADDLRLQYDGFYADSYVYIYRANVSWTDGTLISSNVFRPGTIAVSEDGDVYIAAGSDSDGYAVIWYEQSYGDFTAPYHDFQTVRKYN